MLSLKWLGILLFGWVAAAIAAGQAGLFKGKAPDDLGVRGGRLKSPSLTENSVSSQARLYPGHPQRQYAETAPLALRGDGPATIAKRKGVVQAMPRTKLVKRKADCLYAQFTRLLMKFIDDLAFWYDPEAKAMQVRAAACVGKSDLGANRQRVEAVRKALAGMN